MGLFKKKGEAEADDANRGALFGNRKGKESPAPPSKNPYANPPVGNDPYSSGPPAYPGGGGNQMDSYRSEKTPAYTGQGARGGGYGGGGGGYASQNSYGGGGGNRFGQSPAPQRQGGYGGLGPADEEDRSNLFGGAQGRYEQRQQQQPPGGYQQGGQQSGAYGDAGAGGYGGYGSGPSYDDRQLTAEEQEEEDINASKQEIKFIKQQDVSSTRNALRLAQQAEETGRDTLARLGAQGERIHNTERNLDLASSQNRIAEEKARELKTLNRSMFAVHVSNPFTSKSRAEERDRKIMENHRSDRDQRDATRKAAWESGARNEEAKRGVGAGGAGGPGRSTLADRAKYQFEADSDDDAMENEIDDNLDQLHGAAKRLNQLGRAMGQEVDTQNKHIDRIIGKTDKVDDQIALNRARLDRIH